MGDEYTSHYNRERKQCLVEVSLLRNHQVFYRAVYDAVEHRGVAERFEADANTKLPVTLLVDNRRIPDTLANEQRFEDLMKK